MRHIQILLFLFILMPIKGWSQNSARWKLGLYGHSADDTLSSSKIVGLKGLVNIHHDFTNSLEADLVSQINAETGSSSSLFTDEFSPRNGLTLREGSIKWKIFDPFSIRAGAIAQSHHKSPLLIDEGTFPAALAKLEFQSTNWIFTLDSQAAIPTGKNLSSKSVGKEPTPSLFTEKMQAGWKSPNFSLIGRGTHFQFRNLTHGMAQDSRFYGNSISGISNASTFTNKYEGFETGADSSIELTNDLGWSLGGSFLTNTNGPQNANNGIYAYTELLWKTSDFSIRPKIEFYRNEADSSPAFYSSAEFGHNNRIGSGAVLRLELPKAGINFELRARRSDLIESKTFQKDRFQFFQLMVEIPYANF